MSEQQTLTVEEIKSLLLALSKADNNRKAKVQALVQKKIGGGVIEEDPLTIVVRNKLDDLLSDMMARRLKQNQRTTPLFSSQDLIEFIPVIYNELARVDGELDERSHRMFEQFMKTVMENSFEALEAIVPHRKNPYEEYWRWLTTLRDLAAERGIPPTELLGIEEMSDEITRRMFTKKRLIAFYKRKLEKSMDADTVKKIMLQPLLDLAAEGGEEERRKLEQEFETELMPQLRDTLDKSKVVVKAWIDEEVARIYATA